MIPAERALAACGIVATSAFRLVAGLAFRYLSHARVCLSVCASKDFMGVADA